MQSEKKRDEYRLPESRSFWVRCPVCQGKTRVKVKKDTVLLHFPLYCPKCKTETDINVVQLRLTVNH